MGERCTIFDTKRHKEKGCKIAARKLTLSQHDKSYLKKDIPIVENQFILHASNHILAMLKKQLSKNYKPGEFNKKIYWEYEKKVYATWEKSYATVTKKIKDHIKKLEKDPTFSLTKYFKSTEDEKKILRLI